MLKAQVERTDRERNLRNIDLCYISAITGVHSTEAFDKIVGIFKSRLKPISQHTKDKPKVFDLKDDHAAAAMFSFFRQKKKLMGFGDG